MTEVRVTGLLPQDGSPVQAMAWKREAAAEAGVSDNTLNMHLQEAVEAGEVLRFADLDARNREAIFYAASQGRVTAQAFLRPSSDGTFAGSLSVDMLHWLWAFAARADADPCPMCGRPWI